VPKEHFLAVGGFDSSFPSAAGEDREFCDRWQGRGYRMIYAPQAIVYHHHHLTLRAFWRQHVRYGRAAYRFHALRASRNREPIRVEPLSFYWNLLRYPFQVSRRQWAMQLAALLTLSQVANATGFLWARAHRPSAVEHERTRA
jgi:GT2 family glycosyltransferase